jgi:uncharacterized membrane protein
VARHHSAQRGGRTPALPAVLGTASCLAVIVLLAPARGQGDGKGDGHGNGGSDVSSLTSADTQAQRVQQIISSRCAPCHAHTPTQPGFSAAPNGLVFEGLEQVRAHLPEVQQQLRSRAMPLGNLTGITEQERGILLDWVEQASGLQ